MGTIGWIILVGMFYGLGWFAGAAHVRREWNEDMADEIRRMGGDPNYPRPDEDGAL